MPSLAPLQFDFVAPSRIVFGWGQRREVGSLARSLGRRAFLITGSRTLDSNGELPAIARSLNEAGVVSVRLTSIAREPLVNDVDSAVAILRDARAGAGDLMLAVGGGSAIDLAKAAAALVAQPDAASVRDYLEGVGSGRKIVEPPLPVLALPTTGGTGSEATKNAVISSLDPPFKKSLRSELLTPRIVLVDPELAVSLPPHVTAWTGMDAITQLIESALSRRSTEASRQLAARGLVGTAAALREAHGDGGSRRAREIMALAALLSGMALANSGLGMAHGVAAALGIHCQVPHGLACAALLPVALRANLSLPVVEARLASLAPAFLGQRLDWHADPRVTRPALEPDDRARAVAEEIDRLLTDLAIPRRLSELGVRREQIPEIVRDARGNSMSGNPRDVSDAELTSLLEGIL